ncbi:thiazole synthase [Ochrobactrum anthropi ATCC 49188]|nr:thiazole synthase [Brucella anthropi ATCC 49188]
MLEFYGQKFESRLLLGTAQYPSPAILADAVRASQSDIVTVSLRRESGEARAGQDFWALIRELGVAVLPNTAGCHTPREAVTTAKMAREIFGTNWIKLEVIGDTDTLQPDPFGLVEAARALCDDGFEVFPYMNDDLVVAERLIEAGCKVLMPWGAPIGSGRGLNNPYALKTMRAHFPDIPLVVDAGIGVPSHAAAAMELGYDAVLINTAVAKAGDPVAMARGFALAVEAGRLAFEADAIEARDMAAPSTLFSERHFCDGPRSVLPDLRQRKMAGAHGAARRQAGATARQG